MTDMTMVERVARAICAPNEGFACCGECEVIVEKARAAIAAMAEPTGAMITMGGYTIGKPKAKEVWKAMIDAALLESV